MADDKKKPKPVATPAPPAPPKEPSAWLVKLKKILEKFKALFLKIKNNPKLVKTMQFMVKLGAYGWLKIFTALSLIFLGYGIYKTSPLWKKIWKLPYDVSFLDVSEGNLTISSDDTVIVYNNDLLSPQHIVMINKIVVNLRTSPRSTKNPMAAFDLYVRLDTEEASVEVKDREKQLQDHIQRLCEEFSYDSVLSEEGKNIWKQKIKRELNLVLNTGKVKEVLFKTLIVKP